MFFKYKYFFATLLIVLLIESGYSQIPSHLISTTIHNDCRAKFYDDGGIGMNYNSVAVTGLTYTMQIITNNPVITMTFNPSSSLTQITIGDFLTFYDKFPLIPSNVIAGPYTNIPVVGTIPNVSSFTGSLIVVFTENGNTDGKGWDAGWFSPAPPPTPPTVSLGVAPSCGDPNIILHTSEPVLCDSLKPIYFSMTGPMFQSVTSVSPIPSPCSNGTTNVIQVNVSPPVNQNCDYSITSTLFRVDKCDSVYKYPNIIKTFSIANCPIQASISALPTNTVCSYNCTATLTAIVPASCLTYSYTWDNGLPSTPGPHAICPTVTTVYSCTITELTQALQTIITKTIYAFDPQITSIPNPTVCQSSSNFTLTATPPGGYWYGPGISPSNSLTGIFSPGAGSGLKWVKYRIANCRDSILITVINISAGNPDAACVGASDFTVSPGAPIGGTWLGNPNITPLGVFTPSAAGTYTVLYTVGSCTSLPKTINVVNSITITPSVIPICQSVPFKYLYLNAKPFGGRFSGSPACLNTVYGTFSPSIAPPGPQIMTYSLNGCAQTFTVDVLEINVSPPTVTTCPTKAPFFAHTSFTPTGGVWTCTNSTGSILNTTSGLYDPSIFSTNSHTDVLIYTATNGCSDTLKVKALKTTIVPDSIFFCDNSDSLKLSNNFTKFNYSPTGIGGAYSGPGVIFQAGNYYFKPKIAGQGVHTIYYDINTCSDSVKMVVYPSMISGFSPTVCSTHPTFAIVPPILPGSVWTGAGVTTPSLGIFNPAAVLPGVYTLTYSNKGGCVNTVNIDVYQFQAATVSNLNNTYCFTNNNTIFSTAPINGTLVTVSTMTNYVFNPSVVGAGTHSINYSYGIGACFTSTTFVVKIHPELTTTCSISAPTICLGESCILNVKASGGLPTVTQYTYSWSNGLIPINSQNVVPNITTLYTVTTSDGCSDVVIDVLPVTVSPNYYPAFATESKQCYGSSVQATVNINPSGNYSYNWNTVPAQTSNVISGLAGKNYILKIQNLTTGCAKDTFLIIPGYKPIKALFSPNPNLNCVSFDDNLISFLDLSNGGVKGNWNFNGTLMPYVSGQTVQYLFNKPGTYNVSLDIMNEGNCQSVYSLPICILESTDIFIPDIFSPNKDGNNEVLFVRGNGIKEMKFYVYDRWGNKVFDARESVNGWDGTFNGKDVESGIYAYYLDVTMFNDKKIVKKGDITLIR